MIDDVILNKIEIIKRCIRRVKEEYDCNPQNLENYTKQDSITLNIQRACEAVLIWGCMLLLKGVWGFLKRAEIHLRFYKIIGLLPLRCASGLKR